MNFMNTKMNSIHKDLFYEISDYLSVQDLMSLSSICREFYGYSQYLTIWDSKKSFFTGKKLSKNFIKKYGESSLRTTMAKFIASETLKNRLNYSKNKRNILSLVNLHIPYHYICQIPNCINILKNLTRIDLTNNNITSLPSNFCQLNNLKILILNINGLQDLPIEIGNLSLKILDLSNNRFTYISPSINSLTNLESLNLSWNKIPMRVLDRVDHIAVPEHGVARLHLWD